jgi:phage tail sheath protein FI
LWGQLVEMCERFLTPILQNRGLYGFYVQCNDKNNTPDIIAAGNCILDVYVDPVIPAKRIHLNAIVSRTGTLFNYSVSTPTA